MDSNRKKQLLEEYRNRKPDMGIIALKCLVTNDIFLEKSKDIKASFNGIKCRLHSKGHPNKEFQKLWDAYGESGFELYIEKELKYDDPQKDQSKELEKLMEECLLKNNQTRRLWR